MCKLVGIRYINLATSTKHNCKPTLSLCLCPSSLSTIHISIHSEIFSFQVLRQMAPPDRPRGSLPPQQQNCMYSEPVEPRESLQHHQTQPDSGLPSLPQTLPSWTDLTGPDHAGSGQTKQDFSRRQQSSQMNNTQSTIPGQAALQQPLPIPLEAQQPQPQPQQMRSQNGAQSALPAEAVLVPHTIGQVGSHVFPIANGQYQIRVISYMEVLIPMVPCPAQPPSQ